MTLEQRLDKVEQQNRKLKKYMAGVGVLALMAIVAGLPQWTTAASTSATYKNLTVTGGFRLKPIGSKTLVRISASSKKGIIEISEEGNRKTRKTGTFTTNYIRIGTKKNAAGLYTNKSSGGRLRLWKNEKRQSWSCSGIKCKK